MLKKPKINIISLLGEYEALQDGDFELPCGLHIQSYVDTTALMQYPSIAAKIGESLAGLFDKKADVVFSPTVENSVIAQEVARVKKARAVFATDENGFMKLKGSMTIKEGEKVLIVDNVTMTGKKVQEACALVTMLKAQIVGIAVIVDRSQEGACDNVPLRALLTYPLDTYTEENCPMCAANIPLVKKGENK